MTPSERTPGAGVDGTGTVVAGMMDVVDELDGSPDPGVSGTVVAVVTVSVVAKSVVTKPVVDVPVVDVPVVTTVVAGSTGTPPAFVAGRNCVTPATATTSTRPQPP